MCKGISCQNALHGNRPSHAPHLLSEGPPKHPRQTCQLQATCQRHGSPCTRRLDVLKAVSGTKDGYTVENDEMNTFLLAVEASWRRLVGAFGSRVAFFLTDAAGSFEHSRIRALRLRVTAPCISINSSQKIGGSPFFATVETFPIIATAFGSGRALTGHMASFTTAMLYQRSPRCSRTSLLNLPTAREFSAPSSSIMRDFAVRSTEISASIRTSVCIISPGVAGSSGTGVPFSAIR